MGNPEKPNEKIDIKAFLNDTTLESVMAKNVISIRDDAPFSLVPKKMEENNIRHLPVINKEGELVGLITQRDLYRIQPPHKLLTGELYYDDKMLDDIILKHAMTKNPDALMPQHGIGKALMKMVYGKADCVPIIDKNNKLCGIITRGDILRLAVKAYTS